MKFVIGLGNPGEEYKSTRHSIGYEVLDLFAQKQGMEFELKKDLQAYIAKKDDLVLIKPTTYMNDSGEAARQVVNYFAKELLKEAELKNLWLVHDDLDLKLGQLKLVFDSGPKIHNGVNSVRDELGTQAFWYVRLGIDGRTPDNCIPAHDYVLMKFEDSEQAVVKEMTETAVSKLYATLSAT